MKVELPVTGSGFNALCLADADFEIFQHDDVVLAYPEAKILI